MKRWALLATVAGALLVGWLVLREEARGEGQVLALDRNAEGSAREVGGELAAPGGPATATVERARPAERERVAARAGRPAARRVEGVVLDVHSGRPVPDAARLGVVFRVETGDYPDVGERRAALDVPLGPGGTFAATVTDPERLLARVVEWDTRTPLEEGAAHGYASERDADGRWILPLDVGWFARLEPVAPGAEALVLRHANLTDTLGLDEQHWSGRNVSGGERPFVLFPRAHRVPAGDERRFLQVSAVDAGGRWCGRVEVPARNGVLEGDLVVPLSPLARVTGRVLDEAGAPWESAGVQVLPTRELPGAAPVSDLWDETDEQGLFDLDDIAPGPVRVQVSAPFTRPVELELVVAGGANDLGTLVLPRGGARHIVSGVLVARDDGPDDPFAVLRLEALDGELELVTIAGFEMFQENDGRAPFAFIEVPEGAYRLTVVTPDGRDYPDAPVELRVPCDQIVLEASPEVRAPVELVCRDARTGGAVEHDMVLVREGGMWISGPGGDRGPYAGAEALLVWAEGYVPRRVEPFEPVPAADGSLRVEVELEPGWGRIVFVRERSDSLAGQPTFDAWFGRGLPGAAVLASGDTLARTDAGGLALISSPEPGSLSLDAPGFRLLETGSEDGLVFMLVERER